MQNPSLAANGEARIVNALENIAVSLEKIEGHLKVLSEASGGPHSAKQLQTAVQKVAESVQKLTQKI